VSEPSLHYLIGDATDPIIKPALICHVCNSVNGWGRGFVMSLSSINKKPEEAYHKWYEENRESFVLGAIQIVPFTKDTWVGNMIAQHGVRWEGKVPPIRYDALETCLKRAYKYAKNNSLTVAAPRLGCVLSGGTWDRIEEIIKNTMLVDTYIYTLESQKDRWATDYENLPESKNEEIIIEDTNLF